MTDFPLDPPIVGAGSLLTVIFAVVLCGCGVQSAHKKTAAQDCGAIKAMTVIKRDMDTLDRKIRDLHPSTVTLESVRQLAPVYRDAASAYAALQTKASTQSTQAGSTRQPADLIDMWRVMVESLKLRHDGIKFYAEAFSHPENLSHSKLAKGQTYIRKMNQLNSTFKSSITRLLSNRGFRQRSDGQFVISC